MFLNLGGIFSAKIICNTEYFDNFVYGNHVLIYLYLVDLEHHKDTKYSLDYQFIQHVSYPELRLVESITNVVELGYQYPEMKESFAHVLGGRLTDVYSNEQYTCVTQYAVQNDSVTGYYIVKMLPPVKKGVPWKVIGSLSKGEYELKKQELHLNEQEMKHTSF